MSNKKRTHALGDGVSPLITPPTKILRFSECCPPPTPVNTFVMEMKLPQQQGLDTSKVMFTLRMECPSTPPDLNYLRELMSKQAEALLLKTKPTAQKMENLSNMEQLLFRENDQILNRSSPPLQEEAQSQKSLMSSQCNSFGTTRASRDSPIPFVLCPESPPLLSSGFMDSLEQESPEAHMNWEKELDLYMSKWESASGSMDINKKRSFSGTTLESVKSPSSSFSLSQIDTP